MTNLQRVILLGFAIITAFILVHGLYFIKHQPVDKPATSQSNFAVVDTYKGCDVVRWALPNHAEYKYFLHCGQ